MDSHLNPPFDKYDPCRNCKDQNCQQCETLDEENAEHQYDIFLEMEELFRPEPKREPEPAPVSLFDERLQKAIKNVRFAALEI